MVLGGEGNEPVSFFQICREDLLRAFSSRSSEQAPSSTP